MKAICLIGMLFVCGVCARAGAVMSVDPSPLNVFQGNTFTVNIDLESDNPNIAAFDFAVLFPASLLQAVTVTEEGFFAANGCCFSLLFDPSSNIDNVNGVINSLADSTTGGATDNLTDPTTPDTLVSIQFQAIASGIATVQLTCDGGDTLPCTSFPMLSDVSENAVTVDTLNSSTVTITPEPSSAVCLLGLGLAWLSLRASRRA